MNMRWKDNPIFLQFLLGCLLFLFLTILSYVIGLLQPSISSLALFARANSTRTAIALTSQALYGPFPTATGPTVTASWTPSMTPTPTVTPSYTPTPTLVHYFIDTSTPRTLVPKIGGTSTGVPTSVQPTSVQPTDRPPATRTSVPPTQPPRPTSTSVQATDPPPQPTNSHRRATKTARPPRSTRTPRRLAPIAACIDLQGCTYFASEKLYDR